MRVICTDDTWPIDRAQGLLERVEDRVIQTPYGDRSGVVVEPYLTDQWYVAADVLAKTGFLLGARGLDTVHALGGEALAVTTEGAVLTTPGIAEYLA